MLFVKADKHDMICSSPHEFGILVIQRHRRNERDQEKKHWCALLFDSMNIANGADAYAPLPVEVAMAAHRTCV